MNTLARLWLLLSAFYTVAHQVIVVVVWRSIDLRFETVVEHLAIPFLQAWALAWAIGALSGRDFLPNLKKILSRPAVLLLWCAEAALLWYWHWASKTGGEFTGIILQIAALEGLLAGFLIIVRFFIPPRPGTWAALLPFTMVILLLGSNGITPWFQVLYRWLPHGWPLLLKQALLLGAAVIPLILYTRKACVAFSKKSPLAGLVLSCMQPFVMVAGMTIVLNGYLFAHFISPWYQIMAASLSLAATCLLSGVLATFRNSDSHGKMAAPPKSDALYFFGLWGLWSVLALPAFACVVVLRIAWFPHWDDLNKAFLGLLAIPLIQTAWIRWFQSIKRIRRLPIHSSKKRGLGLPVLLILEGVVVGLLVFSESFRETEGFSFFLSVWLGIKLIFLGIQVTREAPQMGTPARWQKVCGTISVISGIGTAFMGGLCSWIWMIAAVGAGVALLVIGRGCYSQGKAGSFVYESAEALMIPILAAAGCMIMVNSWPVILWVHMAYGLMVFSTSFMAAATNGYSMEKNAGRLTRSA